MKLTKLFENLLKMICDLLARWGVYYCRRRELLSPVITVNGALVRPREILVDIAYEAEIADRLRELGGRPYVPSGDEDDWRQHPLLPHFGDVNAQLDEARLRCHLWVGFSTRRAVALVRKRELPGVHFNSVYLLGAVESVAVGRGDRGGTGYYQGGPVGYAAPFSGPLRFPPHLNTSTVEVEVLDTGMPANWKTDYKALANTVTEVKVGTVVKSDPLGVGNVVESHGAHGLFICGLIARQHPMLDIRSRRVMSPSGEVDDTIASPTITNSLGAVINLSFSGETPNGNVSFAMGNAVAAAVQKDQVLVAAAGNDGGHDPSSSFHNRKVWPAAHPDVIAVGAFDSTNQNPGPSPVPPPPPVLPQWTNQAEIYAPGVNLLSMHAIGWTRPQGYPLDPYQGWAMWSGTSVATPVVAAEIAKAIIDANAGNPGGITRRQAAADWLAKQPKSSTWPDKPPAAPGVFGKQMDPAPRLTSW